MNIVTNYREKEELRRSFNALAEATFGLSFESWYRLGWWTDNYMPYSVVEDGKVVANVSLNRTDMVIGGQRKRIYQLGTVMTDPAYRNRGYIRAIMAKIEEDIAGADGVYLFANDSVVTFYPKFGFTENQEFCYRKSVKHTGPCTMVPVKMDTVENRERLASAMAKSSFPTGCTMVDNPGLIFFYASQFMQDNAYYSEALDAWVIAGLEEGELMLYNVFAGEAVTLEQVIAAFGGDVRRVTLGFTPADPVGFQKRQVSQKGCHFFVKGDFFREFEAKELRIPTLSHA